jgi:hypothetical protein
MNRGLSDIEPVSNIDRSNSPRVEFEYAFADRPHRTDVRIRAGQKLVLCGAKIFGIFGNEVW